MSDNPFPQYAMGKTPARKGSVSFRFKRYVDLNSLGEIPASFGEPEPYVSHWGLYDNDRFATGVFAGFAQETVLRARINGDPIEFTDWMVLGDYAEASGFAFSEKTDLGIDLDDAARFRRKVGISDYQGARHHVAGYAALKPRNVDELAAAVYLFGSVGVGLEISTRALAQFDDGEEWDVTRRGRIVGTTYVPIVGRRENGNFIAIAWGRVQELTPTFYEKYNDESVVFFPEETVNGVSPVEGFKSHLLLKDLRKLAASGE